MKYIMKYVKNYFAIFKLNEFDSITRFRLLNAFLVGIGISLLAPIIVLLKGALLPVWIIAVFGILTTLTVKTNTFFCKFSLSQLYRLGIGVHLILIMAASVYFWNPLLMIILESIVGITEVAVFSAYTVMLNNHLATDYPESMKSFQIIRNNSWADAALIGLGLVSLITIFSTTGTAVTVFVIYNSLFSLWMIYNWNFYEDHR